MYRTRDPPPPGRSSTSRSPRCRSVLASTRRMNSAAGGSALGPRLKAAGVGQAVSVRAFTVVNIHSRCAPAKFLYLSLVALIRASLPQRLRHPGLRPPSLRSIGTDPCPGAAPGEYAELVTGTYLKAFAMMEAVDPGTLSAFAGLVGSRGAHQLASFHLYRPAPRPRGDCDRRSQLSPPGCRTNPGASGVRQRRACCAGGARTGQRDHP